MSRYGPFEKEMAESGDDRPTGGTEVDSSTTRSIWFPEQECQREGRGPLLKCGGNQFGDCHFAMFTTQNNARRAVFSTELGWMALVGTGEVLGRLVFGYSSAEDAERALGSEWLERSREASWNSRLQRRLRDYAAGEYVEFDDIPVVMDNLTGFAREVILAARETRYGHTTTYGRLASQAGSPKAARAVGNLMAANPIPLVIPCHRVVYAGGRIGHFSAPGGSAMKRLLLEMERRWRADIRAVRR